MTPIREIRSEAAVEEFVLSLRVPGATDGTTPARRELERDPRFPRWPEAERARLIDTALEAGRAAAAAYTGQNPMGLAEAFGLRIAICEGSNVVAGRLVRAEIDAAARTITLYRTSLDEHARMLAPVWPGCNTFDIVRNLYVAHELFHHLEAIASPVLICPWPPVVLTTGRLISIRRAVPACREIAAHAFAQALTGVEFFPTALDDGSFVRPIGSPGRANRING